MPEHKYKLFSLIEGDSTAFRIDVVPSETIGDLKERIKDKKPNGLKNVDANRLKLCQVDTPDGQEIDPTNKTELTLTGKINR